VSQARRRRRGQECGEARLGKPAYPVAEHPGREAVRGDDDLRGRRRPLDEPVADRAQGQVAERAAAVPALEPRRLGDTLGQRRRVDVRERGEPLDPRESVSALPAALRIEEVIREQLRVRLGEAERADPGTDLVRCHERRVYGILIRPLRTLYGAERRSGGRHVSS